MAAKFVAAIDHGTTSTRCMLFDGKGQPVATAQRAQTMYYPQPGWVELDMDEVWRGTQECIHEALGSAGASLAGVGGERLGDGARRPRAGGPEPRHPDLGGPPSGGAPPAPRRARLPPRA